MKKTSRAPLAASAIVVAAAASALATGPVWAAPTGSHVSMVPSPPVPTPLCSSKYSEPIVWDGGFNVSVDVTNSGTRAITGWTVTLIYPATDNQALQAGWNGNWSQSGETVTITNLPYNGNLASGASATAIGADFNYSGTHTAPTIVACTANP